MLNWRQIVVGDAFRLSSRDPNYYRDLALVWPLLLFSVIAVFEFFEKTTTHGHRTAMAVIAVLCFMAAKEKLVLLAASSAIISLRCFWACAVGARTVGLMVAAIVIGGISAVLFFVLRNRRLSYEWPEQSGTIELAVGVGSLVATLTLKIWLDKLLV